VAISEVLWANRYGGAGCFCRASVAASWALSTFRSTFVGLSGLTFCNLSGETE
jgi:hypothetical protein